MVLFFIGENDQSTIREAILYMLDRILSDIQSNRITQRLKLLLIMRDYDDNAVVVENVTIKIWILYCTNNNQRMSQM